MRERTQLQATLRKSYTTYQKELGTEAISDMAFPSYLFGNKLSRYVFWKKLDYVIAAAELKDDMKVFDFGCGSGILLPTLCQDNRTVYATDLRLGPAQHLAQEISLQQIEFFTSAEWEAKIEDNSLDVIVAANVLEHVKQRRELLWKLANKLVSGGRMVISGPTENSLYKLGRRIVGFSGDYHVGTVADVFEDVLAVGFKAVYWRNWPLPKALCLYQIAAFTMNR